MDRPLVAFDRVAGCLARRELDAGEEEGFALGKLQVKPHAFAIGTPEFVTGNLHRHRPLVKQPQSAAVGVDVPDAVQQMPRAFMTELEQRRVGRRELNVPEPAFIAVNKVCFPRGDFDGEELLRPFRLEDLVEPRRLWPAGVNSRSTFDERARQQGRIGVHGRNLPAEREPSDFARCPRVQVRDVKRARP